MHMADIPLLSMLKDRMSWLSARQSVLSQNVANADSPGYTAHDLKPLNFEEIMRNTGSGHSAFNTGLRATNARHITITPTLSRFERTDSPDGEANPLGNTVSLEEEMIKVADTQAQYQAATNLYSKAINMMRTAIGRV